LCCTIASYFNINVNNMPTVDEQEKVDKKNDDIELLRQSLNSFYIDVIRNAQSVQNKFPLAGVKGGKIHENECSRDNLVCYLALREHDLSDIQLKLAEQGLSSLGRLESQVLVSIEKVIKNLGLPIHETHSLCKPTFTDARSSLAKRSQLLLG